MTCQHERAAPGGSSCDHSSATWWKLPLIDHYHCPSCRRCLKNRGGRYLCAGRVEGRDW